MSLGRDHWGHLSCLFCKVSIFAPGLCESWSEEYMLDIAFGAAFPVSHRALKLCKHKISQGTGLGQRGFCLLVSGP